MEGREGRLLVLLCLSVWIVLCSRYSSLLPGGTSFKRMANKLKSPAPPGTPNAELHAQPSPYCIAGLVFFASSLFRLAMVLFISFFFFFFRYFGCRLIFLRL
jgi:hypothetical protein